MTLRNIIEFRDWLFDFTAKMKNDHVFGEQEVLYFVKDKFSSLGLNDNKIDKEPIDENKLDELAKKYPLPISGGEVSEHIEYLIDEAYKAGYRKAKEE